MNEIGQALTLYDEHKFANASVIYTTAGEIELRQKNYARALFYFNHDTGDYDSESPGQTLIDPEKSLFIARALVGLTEFEKAKTHIDACKGLITNDQGLALKYYLTLVDYFKATNRFDSALAYNEKALKLSQNIDSRQSLEAVEVVRINENYEHENSLLRQQVETQVFEQKLYIVIVLLSVLSVAFLVYAMAVKRRDFKLLQSQNDEIAAQAEELRALTDELAAQGDSLRQANEILEAKVDERTASLRAKNAQLTQYAFFNAHKLRSPVATLLGLKQLLEISSSPKERDVIMGSIFITSEKLDDVVRESQKLLDDVDGDHGA